MGNASLCCTWKEVHDCFCPKNCGLPLPNESHIRFEEAVRYRGLFSASVWASSSAARALANTMAFQSMG